MKKIKTKHKPKDTKKYAQVKASTSKILGACYELTFKEVKK